MTFMPEVVAVKVQESGLFAGRGSKILKSGSSP